MPKVTMNLTDRDAENTNRIRDATLARSNAHAVSIALSLTKFIVEALQRDNDLLIRKPNGEFERIVMTELANVTPIHAVAAE
jgi:hypothetical protein